MAHEKTQKRVGKRPGRKPSKIDQKAKLERSRQSARECRARKKLRYQYLEELVSSREKAVFSLRDELEMVSKQLVKPFSAREFLPPPPPPPQTPFMYLSSVCIVLIFSFHFCSENIHICRITVFILLFCLCFSNCSPTPSPLTSLCCCCGLKLLFFVSDCFALLVFCFIFSSFQGRFLLVDKTDLNFDAWHLRFFLDFFFL